MGGEAAQLGGPRRVRGGWQPGGCGPTEATAADRPRRRGGDGDGEAMEYGLHGPGGPGGPRVVAGAGLRTAAAAVAAGPVAAGPVAAGPGLADPGPAGPVATAASSAATGTAAAAGSSFRRAGEGEGERGCRRHR